MITNIIFKYLMPIIIICLIGCNDSRLIELSYEEYLQKVSNGELPDPEDIIIKDEYRNIISIDSMVVLHQKRDYFDKYFKNKNDEIVVYQLSPKPKFRDISISCNEVEKLLDSLYLIDQSIRSRSNYDPKQDYSNLELVINVIEKCGMPKKARSLKTVFMIIQHNHSNYQRKYIEDFRKAASLGHLSKVSLAMMEDRILISENKPQLYGTQVKRSNSDAKWELYNVYQPQKVDKRRAKMNLGPIKEYLKTFDIEFEIDQIE